MNMIYITCNASMQEKIHDILDDQNIREYQITDQVMAKSKVTAPRFNTPVWPGYNTTFYCQVNETKKVESLLETLKGINQNAFNNSEMITVCTWPLEHYFFGEKKDE